jgi:tRNA(Arg) A34 adenosine deaminase TadA
VSAAPHAFDWADLAFASKKPVNQLNATFIVAPRELSVTRIKQLLKQYLPQGHLVLGISKEDHVLGLENQPAFRMLQISIIDIYKRKLNTTTTGPKLYTLTYSQRDLPYLLDKLDFQKIVLINGSWYRAFHLRPEYYKIAERHLPYEMISPFADESEAKAYATTHQPPAPKLPTSPQTATQMLALANAAAVQSFDSAGFQIGVALGRRITPAAGQTAEPLYQPLATTFNPVVPYQTYAMHHGASRERHFSPMNDLNHYDTNHAEVELIIQAARTSLDLRGTTLFINLLPCPTCARMLSQTDIAEFIYTTDHSAGYAITMLEAAGKTIKRIIPK